MDELDEIELDEIVDEILGAANPTPEPAPAGRNYSPRVCGICGEEYIPTGPRQKVCKACGRKSTGGDERMNHQNEEVALPSDGDNLKELVPGSHMYVDGLLYAAPTPDPIADVATAYRYLRDIAEHWNITVLNLLLHIERMDAIARAMGNAGEK